MRNPQAVPQKYLINCRDGANNPEQATSCCPESGAGSVQPEGYELLAGLIQQFIEIVGQVLA